MADLRPGSRLGQYTIVDQIGQGGMATIFRARQEALGRDVAIKVLPAYLASDPEYLARFRREATAIAQLQHPNILPVFDFGEQDGLTYIVMLLAPSGQTLRDRLGAPMPLASALPMITQVGSALQYAHEQGIVHRDVKPSNVLLGERDWALLSDFGIARMVQGATHLTRTGVGIGTPEYMSPEQAQGLPVDGRADQYSLAVILYQMLTGHLPFVAETPVGIVLQHITKPPPPPRSLNPDIPPQVEAVLLRALSKDPEQRYPTVADFLDALNAAAQPSLRTSPRSVPLATTPRSAASLPAAATRPAVTPVVSPPEEPQTERQIMPSRRRGSRLFVALAVGGVVCAALAIGGGAVGVAALNGTFGGFAALANPTPTPTLPPATAAPTRQPGTVAGTDAEPTPTPTPEPTATPTPEPTPTPVPTNTPPPRPTNTPAPPPPTPPPPAPTSPPPQPPPQPGGGGAGIGTITVRNTSATEVLICAYNGPEASTRLEIPPGGSGSTSVPAGVYTERCVTESGAGPGTRSVTVPAGGTVTRAAP
ncbi:MAG: serine/threonine-protein kinase [Chloroflexota bacterium]|nr:serine/threonine-protein kinase [Chloroflexota bacterium]